MVKAKPRVVFLNRFYWPDEAATAQMLTDLCEDLADAGWTVRVITSNNRYAGGSQPLRRREWHNGVEIVRVGSPHATRFGLVGRAADYATYGIGAFWRLLASPQYDAVVAMTDPPLTVALAATVAAMRGTRCVYWAQDLFPNIAATLGVLNERGPLYKGLAGVARRAHAQCDLVVALGPRMQERLVGAGAAPSRTVVVHNWADTTAVTPVAPRDNPFVSANGLDGKFVILYSGNAGRGHTFDATVEAARRLRDDDDVVFLFVGRGPRIAELREAAAAGGCNMRFLDHVPRSELRYSLSAASISLVTESPAVEGLLVPSKTYGVLASGRPILFVGSRRSDVAAIVEQHDCGFVVEPHDADGLVAVVRRLKERPDELARLGENARHAARLYERRVATSRWESVVGGALGVGSANPMRDGMEGVMRAI